MKRHFALRIYAVCNLQSLTSFKHYKSWEGVEKADKRSHYLWKTLAIAQDRDGGRIHASGLHIHIDKGEEGQW